MEKPSNTEIIATRFRIALEKKLDNYSDSDRQKIIQAILEKQQFTNAAATILICEIQPFIKE